MSTAATVERELFWWAGTLRAATLEERIRAMRAGGFTQMSAFPLDLAIWARAGLTPAEVRARCSDAGVRISVLDPFSQWLPGWTRPAALSDADFAFYDFDQTAFFGLAEALEVSSLTVLEPYGLDVPVDLGAQAFAAVCDRAAQSGMRVHLEFIPFTGIPDLARAWDIVRTAGRANGGLVMDVWHYLLGTPHEALLRTVPGEKIYAVQVSDAAAGARGTIEDLYQRLAPGQGTFDLTSVLTTLNQIGALESVGPEIFSDTLAAMTPEDAGRTAAQTTTDVLDTALVPPEADQSA